MDVVKACSTLSNPTRVHLLKLLAEGPLSATSAHKTYIERYEPKHRESIYRELENLVDNGFVRKEYSNQERSLLYHLCVSEIRIDIEEATVEVNATERS